MYKYNSKTNKKGILKDFVAFKVINIYFEASVMNRKRTKRTKLEKLEILFAKES